MALLLLLTPHLAFSDWDITEFEVFIGEPWNIKSVNAIKIGRKIDDATNAGALDEALPHPAHITEQHLRKIERYLSEVARRYSKMGFRQPTLEPVVTRKDGKKAYRVYLYDFDEDTPAFFNGDCFGGESRQLLSIDMLHKPSSATIDTNGNITNKGYQDLAHELFHSVQAAYSMFNSECELGHWISEGTSQALGVDMARELRGIENKRDPIRWAMRQYDLPLRLGPRNHDAYETASFWRYIGEKAALAGGIPGTDFVAPDYSYLHDFFTPGLPAAASDKSELQWVHERLTNHEEIGIGLNRFYPYFVSTYAAYINNRIPPSAGSDPLVNRTNWLREVFGHCPHLTVNFNEKPAERELKLKPVSAGCWLFGSDIHAPLAVQVTAEGAAPAQLAALAVGTHDGIAVGKPKMVTVKGQNLAQWTFRVDNTPGEQTVFIISNVAEKPETTRAVNVKVKVTVSGWNSSLVGQQ